MTRGRAAPNPGLLFPGWCFLWFHRDRCWCQKLQNVESWVSAIFIMYGMAQVRSEASFNTTVLVSKEERDFRPCYVIQTHLASWHPLLLFITLSYLSAFVYFNMPILDYFICLLPSFLGILKNYQDILLYIVCITETFNHRCIRSIIWNTSDERIYCVHKDIFNFVVPSSKNCS